MTLDTAAATLREAEERYRQAQITYNRAIEAQEQALAEQNAAQLVLTDARNALLAEATGNPEPVLRVFGRKRDAA